MKTEKRMKELKVDTLATQNAEIEATAARDAAWAVYIDASEALRSARKAARSARESARIRMFDTSRVLDSAIDYKEKDIKEIEEVKTAADEYLSLLGGGGGNTDAVAAAFAVYSAAYRDAHNSFYRVAGES